MVRKAPKMKSWVWRSLGKQLEVSLARLRALRKTKKRPVYLGEKRASVSGVLFLRACLYGGGEPQVCEVTRLAVVQK